MDSFSSLCYFCPLNPCCLGSCRHLLAAATPKTTMTPPGLLGGPTACGPLLFGPHDPLDFQRNLIGLSHGGHGWEAGSRPGTVCHLRRWLVTHRDQLWDPLPVAQPCCGIFRLRRLRPFGDRTRTETAPLGSNSTPPKIHSVSQTIPAQRPVAPSCSVFARPGNSSLRNSRRNTQPQPKFEYHASRMHDAGTCNMDTAIDRRCFLWCSSHSRSDQTANMGFCLDSCREGGTLHP